MSLDKGAPTRHPLGRTRIFGNPYHGLVEGGTLTLPNASTMAYAQPDTAWPDQAGTTHKVKKPGIAAVSRTTEELAADVAAGREWRNEAMLSGYSQQLHGHNLGGWIYIDSAGDRWKVELLHDLDSTTFPFADDLDLNFKLTRYGSFGGAATEITYTTSTSAWGQQGYPALQGFQPEGGGFETIAAAHLMIDALTFDGSKAAVCVHRRRLQGEYVADTTVDLTVRHPLGWLQVAISGPGGSPLIVVSVLQSRAQTFEVVTRDFDAGASDVLLPPRIPEGGDILFKISNGTYFTLETLRTVAVWPDAAGTGWVYVKQRYKEVNDLTSSVSSSGDSYILTIESPKINSIAIEVDGVEVQKIDSSGMKRQLNEYEYRDVGSTADVYFRSVISFEELDIDGTTYSLTRSPGAFAYFGPSNPAGTITVNWLESEPYGGINQYDLMFTFLWRRPLTTQISLPEPAVLRVDLCRYSGKVIGQRLNLVSSTVNESRHYPRVTPSGVVGSTEVRTFDDAERLYASWNPATGATADIQDTPLCWV